MLGFSFRNNISTRLLYQLQNVDSRHIIWPNNTNHFFNELISIQPKYILGLGQYSGRDQDKIRIELNCTNKKGNTLIDGNILKEQSINSFFTPSQYSKYAYALGNSQCNQISWKIMQLIDSKRLKSRYTFLHIPKKIDFKIAINQIESELAHYYHK